MKEREIFGHLTQPVVLPETKQKTYKVSLVKDTKIRIKNQRKQTSKIWISCLIRILVVPQPFKPQERTSWTKDFIAQNVMKSQEKMNGVLEMIGDGKFALHHAMNDYKKNGCKRIRAVLG